MQISPPSPRRGPPLGPMTSFTITPTNPAICQTSKPSTEVRVTSSTFQPIKSAIIIRMPQLSASGRSIWQRPPLPFLAYFWVCREEFHLETSPPKPASLIQFLPPFSVKCLDYSPSFSHCSHQLFPVLWRLSSSFQNHSSYTSSQKNPLLTRMN